MGRAPGVLTWAMAASLCGSFRKAALAKPRNWPPRHAGGMLKAGQMSALSLNPIPTSMTLAEVGPVTWPADAACVR